MSKRLCLIVSLILVGLLLYSYYIYWEFVTLSQVDPLTPCGPIIDKYESEGKCLIEVQVEIDPDEYIGYDIGDDYHHNN